MENNEITVDPSDPKDINATVVQLVKECTTFLSYDDGQLEKKFYNLNLLYSMWNKNADEVDYSVEVYASVMEMFASNIFRPLPPSSYAMPIDETTGTAVGGDGGGGGGGVVVVTTDENDPATAQAEFTQMSLVYQAFRAFLDREPFDADKARPHLDRRFVNGLLQRLGSSDTVERMTVRDTVVRLWERCWDVHGHVLDAAVAGLADFAYGYADRHNGVDELLDFFGGDTVDYADNGHAVLDKLCRILIHLLKHQLLFLFSAKFIDCVKSVSGYNRDLIPRMLVFITEIWSNQYLKGVVLLRTMTELYTWCARDKWIQLQSKIVGRLCKLFGDADFQLSDRSMHFWYIILQENIGFWQSRRDDAGIVADALKNVKRTHWNEDCVKTASSLLKLMKMKDVIANGYVEGPEDY